LFIAKVLLSLAFIADPGTGTGDFDTIARLLYEKQEAIN
jgi:hypothetical protein